MEDRIKSLETSVSQILGRVLPTLGNDLANVKAAIAAASVQAAPVVENIATDFITVAAAKITALENWAKTIGSDHARFTPAPSKPTTPPAPVATEVPKQPAPLAGSEAAKV